MHVHTYIDTINNYVTGNFYNIGPRGPDWIKTVGMQFLTPVSVLKGRSMWAAVRVTRLGQFSPNGRLFTLDSFLNTEILGYFSKGQSSDHELQRQRCKNIQRN
jgi:hypothetical protein